MLIKNVLIRWQDYNEENQAGTENKFLHAGAFET
jgi:hypothetical protein